MNPLAKFYWIARGVGWENLPRRLLQAWQADLPPGRVQTKITSSPAPLVTLVTGREEPAPLGWVSEHFGQRRQTPTLLAVLKGDLSLRLTTTITLPSNDEETENAGD